MAHHEMIDGVMKELMRGIKIAAEPINQHNCAYNDTGAISNTGQRADGGRDGGPKGGRGTDMVSTMRVNVKSTLMMFYGFSKSTAAF